MEVTNPTDQEKQLALLAHLSILLSLISSGILGWVVSLIIYLTQKDKSAFVKHHAIQALFYQVATGIFFVILGIIATILMCAAGLGILIILLMLPLGIAALILGVYAGIKAFNGEWYRYPVTDALVQKYGATL